MVGRIIVGDPGQEVVEGADVPVGLGAHHTVPGETRIVARVEDEPVGVFRVQGGVRGGQLGAVAQAEQGDPVLAEGGADVLPVLGGLPGVQRVRVPGGAEFAGLGDEGAVLQLHAHRVPAGRGAGAVHRGGAGEAAGLDGDHVPFVGEAGGPLHGGTAVLAVGAEEAVGVAAGAARVAEQGAAPGGGVGGGDADEADGDLCPVGVVVMHGDVHPAAFGAGLGDLVGAGLPGDAAACRGVRCGTGGGEGDGGEAGGEDAGGEQTGDGPVSVGHEFLLTRR